MIQNKSAVITVSQLNFYIKSLFDSDVNLSYVFLSGEISNFTNHYRTGHLYMTLKDANASVKAVMFRSSASRLKFVPENGMKVIVKGRVSVFERDGQYQVYIDDMQPDGAGALTIAFEQLKLKLQKQGLFDMEAKKPIPKFPRKIGVVTSPTGAAIQDIRNIVFRRFPSAEIILYPVLVQGDGAAQQIADAIEYFNQNDLVDVLIVGRGGGSIEDLWAFNEEIVAYAIYNSIIPVISAVGHETDFTISDFVADLRAPTPSAAAELAVPDKAELLNNLKFLLKHCNQAMADILSGKRNELEYITSSVYLKNPLMLIRQKQMQFDSVTSRIRNSALLTLAEEKTRFAKAASALDSLSPFKVLARGYSVVTDADGKIISASKDLKKDDIINIKFSKGNAECIVLSTGE